MACQIVSSTVSAQKEYSSMAVESSAIPTGTSPGGVPLTMGPARITRARAMAYHVPTPKAAATNYLVMLELADQDGRFIEGIGEGQPRGDLTGDTEEHSWEFLQQALRMLSDRALSLGDSAACVNQVRQIAAELGQLALEINHDAAQKRSYRGALLGLELALLDMFARALGVPLYELLGKSRDQAAGAPPSAPVGSSAADLRGLLRHQFDHYSHLRLQGPDGVAEAVGFMEKAAAVDRSRSGEHKELSLWVEFDGVLNRQAASSLVRETVLSMAAGFMPAEVLLEQPVPVKYGDHLPVLQREADDYVREAGREDLRLTVMGDESIWDQKSLRRLKKLGALRAVTVRPGQAGGLLAALDLAQMIAGQHEAAVISLNSMDGGSRITRSAIEHLALTLPRVDAVQVNCFKASLLPFAQWLDGSAQAIEDDAAGDQGVLTARNLPGIGLTLDYSALVSDVERFAQFPPLPEPTNEGQTPARYEHVDDVRPLGPNGTKGYLLEKHALARGLSTTRYSKSAFVVSDGVRPNVGFKWSRSSVSSAVAMSVCTHKEATRLALEEAGAPTPQGRTFRNGDFTNARVFVALIGFPVVVKPSMGIRGIGVVAGIDNNEQLEDAFALMGDSKFGGQDFIVEKHINGRDHRILVVGDEVVGAIQRKPASVLGDGRSTIAELLLHRNVARRNNPHLWTRPAKPDATMAHHLNKLGLTLASVLPVGREAMLSNTANISQGADSIDVFDRLHPSIVEACLQAVAAIPGMQYCGVDFLLEDPAKPVDQQDAAIIELNAHAAIGNCEYPMFGQGRPVAQRLMDLTIDQYQLEAQDPAEDLTVRLIVRGKVTGVGFREWLEHHANKVGARGWVRNLEQRTMETVIHGPTERVTPLIASCILGPEETLPTSYQATVLPSAADELEEGFEIRTTPRLQELSSQEKAEIAAMARVDESDFSAEHVEVE